MTIFRPSASLRITIRCEEYEETSELDALLPEPDFEEAIPNPFYELPSQAPSSSDTDSIDERLARNQERRRILQSRRSELSEEQYRSQISQIIFEEQDLLEEARQNEEAENGSAPQSVAGRPPDDRTVIGNIYPISATIERNGIAQADTANIDIPWIDLPLDPRIIRAAHVQLVIGSVTASDYEAGMLGQTREDGSLPSVIRSSDDGATQFIGFVDLWKTKYSESGDTITLECRDMSALIRDRKLGASERIDMTVPIDRGIFDFLERLGPSTAGIEVVYEGDGDAPTPGESMPQRRRTRRGRGAQRGRVSGENMTAWDHITDVTRSIGFIAIMRGFRLVIIEPRTLYSGTDSRRMIYGINLTELSFERNMLGMNVPTIEVRSYDSERCHTIWARYPVRNGQIASGIVGVDSSPRPTRANNVSPSGSTPSESIRVMNVSGINDSNVLARIARNIFEQIGRQEIEGSFSTSNIWSYDRPEAGADMLSLDSGDPVEVLMMQVDPRDTEREEQGQAISTARAMAMTRDRRRDYLMSLGWERRIAERFASLQDATGFQTVFRTRRATIKYSADKGISISVKFINYITIREDNLG
jgi:hypothetical protein